MNDQPLIAGRYRLLERRGSGGMGHELGMVRAGYLADLLLVDGDPLADITLFQEQARLLMIMKDGTFVKSPTPARQGSLVTA